MAQAKQCDRCGRFYEPYSTKIMDHSVNGMTLIKRYPANIGYDTMISMDLCPQCIHSLNKWLTEENDDESISE